MINEWENAYGIHCHGKRVSLCGAFLGKEGFPINEQLCIVSVGVCQDDRKWRTECVDVVECCFTIEAVKCI